MHKFFFVVFVTYCLGASSTLAAYDASLAEKFDRLFSKMKGAETGKALQIMTPESFIDHLKSGHEFMALDIRTPAETEVLGLNIPNSINIPLDSLFKEENLARIPIDRPVVVVCKSGVRATAAGISLRHLGFEKVYILSGGFQELSRYYGTGQAYPKEQD